MMIYRDDKVLRLRLASVSDIVDASAEPLTLEYNQSRKEHYFTKRDGKEWLGLPTGKAVAKAVAEGWSAGGDRITALHEKTAVALPKAVWHGRKRIKADQGDELDIHAVMRGELDRAWTKSVRRVKHGSSAITLYVDIGANGGTHADSLTWRGLAGVALARIMEAAGYSVEIIGGFHIHSYLDKGKCPPAVVTVTVKPRHARADNATLAGTVALPGFFRTFGFWGIIKAADYLGKEVDSLLGRVASLDAPGMVETDTRTVPVIMPQLVHDEDSAVAWINETVQLLQHSTIDRG